MKKSKITIKCWIDGHEIEKQVTGLVSQNFGIHRDNYGAYTITHLKTGFRLTYCELQKDARRKVEQLEQIKDINKMTLSNADDYIPQMKTIIQQH